MAITLIEIREREQIADDEFSAEVVFDHGAPYPITVKDPFTEAEERRLEWYFEQHLRFPFTDRGRTHFRRNGTRNRRHVLTAMA